MAGSPLYALPLRLAIALRAFSSFTRLMFSSCCSVTDFAPNPKMSSSLSPPPPPCAFPSIRILSSRVPRSIAASYGSQGQAKVDPAKGSAILPVLPWRSRVTRSRLSDVKVSSAWCRAAQLATRSRITNSGDGQLDSSGARAVAKARCVSILDASHISTV